MEEKMVRSMCGFCHANCGIKVSLVDGRIHRLEGDPDHPSNRGYLCPKAQAIKPLLESPDRLKYPLKKTSRGFARISWDEALDLAATKLDRIRQDYGPESLLHCHGAPVTYCARDGFFQFMGVFGSPNFTGASNLCSVPRRLAFMDAFGGRPEPDLENSRLVIFWASNPVNSTRYTQHASADGFNRLIPRARQRGARIIVIDPLRTETAALADDWVRPNIGTDTALGLAMAHTIVNEGLYDKAFVDRWLLAFDEIKQHLAPLTPAWAEKITAVPAARIQALARLYASTDGAVIVDGNGMDMHTNGVDMVRMVCLLIALTGNIDKKGGNPFFSFIPQTPLPTLKPTVDLMSRAQFPLFPNVPFPFLKESLLNAAPHRPRALIVHHANPVLVQAHRPRTLQALSRLEFLMVLDIFPTATTRIADLVLPAAAASEMVDYRAFSSPQGGFVALREKLVDPPGEALSVFEIEYLLARRMGLAQGYPFRNAEEWLDFVLKPAHITLADLRKTPVIYGSPAVTYQKYQKAGFNTPSGKVECFSTRFQAAGLPPLPVFVAPHESPATDPGLAERFPLSATTRRIAEYVHTKLFNLPTPGRLYPDPLLQINPQDAAQRGLAQSDSVEVASPRGKIHLTAHLTPDVPPGLVTIDFGWGNPTDNKAAINDLSPDETWDPVSGGYPNRLFMCQVTKAGS